MKETLLLCLIAISAVATTAAAAKHPVIGVLTKPMDEKDPTKGSFLTTHIVRWMQSSAIRVVPILYDTNSTALDAQLAKLNGVLFTGGGVTLKSGGRYFETQRRIFQHAVKARDFPLFGVCLGFEALCILAADDESVLSGGFDSSGLPLPLEFLPESAGSRLFGDLPSDLATVFKTRNVTLNDHIMGIKPETMTGNARLKAFFKALSVNSDRKGKRFISTIEARDPQLPIFGTQWHPECNAWLWEDELGTDHSPDAVWASFWMLRRFAEAAIANRNHFESEEAEVAALIDRFVPSYDLSDGTQMWRFPQFQ